MEPQLPYPLNQRYRLRLGQRQDRHLVRQWMGAAYRERYPNAAMAHVTETVHQLWSAQSHAWLLECLEPPVPSACGGLWLGSAIHQGSGDHYPHILLLYVSPAHRRQGLGTALMDWVEAWAIAQGYRQIGLHVFVDNSAALTLYQQRGYTPEALFCCKPLVPSL